MTNPVHVLIGTTKGAFVLRDTGDRTGWALSGPYCDGAPINHFIGHGNRLWAAGGGGSDGRPLGVWRSRDGGQSWVMSAAGLEGLQGLWSLHRVGECLYLGSKPAALFVSDDEGASWTKITGLTDHADAPGWNPGAAGLVLHSIVHDPGDANKMWVGISAAGVYATEDGGKTWEQRNRLANSESPTSYAAEGEVCSCVHNIVRAEGEPDLMYQQNHQGTFRSRDGGRVWNGIYAGLPSTFGFPIRVHPRDPRMIWTFPLNGDSTGRYPPEASAAVWRSVDGGESWERKGAGLPQADCYMTVLRQGMAVDAAEPLGVYVGTNTGSVFASRDEGETWEEIARHLPTVLCVEVLEG